MASRRLNLTRLIGPHWPALSAVSTSAALAIGRELRRTVYHHLHRLSLSYYEQRKTGETWSRD
jgi:ABC-type multidrug transport system fused ATPase/permease subunit